MRNFEVIGRYGDGRADKVYHMDSEKLALNWDAIRRSLMSKKSGINQITVRIKSEEGRND